MKNTTRLLNLLSAFMAVIGACAAALVCFIVIYTGINGGFSPKTNTSSTQTDIVDSANIISDKNISEIIASSEDDFTNENSNNNLDNNNYAPTIISTPKPEAVEPDFDIAFAGNEVYAPIEMQNSEIVESNTQSTGILSTNENNFNIYYNPDQQQTTNNYVLNTNPDRMKIHYPSCNDVLKIAPENYSTSNLSVSELESQGYTTCGHCF